MRPGLSVRCTVWGGVCTALGGTALAVFAACGESSAGGSEADAGGTVDVDAPGAEGGEAGPAGSAGRSGAPGRSGGAGRGGAGSDGAAGSGSGGGEGCVPSDEPDEPDDAFEDTNCDGIDGDKEAAIFVAGPGGLGTDANDGTFDAPVKTISRGIALAQSTGKRAVYVCSGVYEGEELSIVGTGGAVSLYGGYNCLAENKSWRRNAGDNVLVRPASGVPLVIADATQTIVIERLSFLAPAATQSGGSSYAVQVRNASDVRIRHAELQAGAAKGGLNGAPGGSGSALACGGVFDCSNGQNGFNGAPGAPGLGSFGPLGYVVGQGQKGAWGLPGGHGTVAPVPAVITVQFGKCSEANNCTLSNDTAQGQRGRCGCGGGQGEGGTGAWGGGASVGLYVYGASSVRLEASTVRSGKGGRGGVGGVGGQGAPGASGVQGASASYDRFSCEEDCPAKNPECGILNCADVGGGSAPGTKGGPGGRGGVGGVGGSGAGGPSFAVVTAGGAEVDVTGSTLEPGVGGLGGTGAPNGASGKQQAF